MLQRQLILRTTFVVLSLICSVELMYFLTDSFNDSHWSKQPPARIGRCGPLAFTQHPLPVTGLASFPGSGNTLLRSLIQESTGILTGSEYVDQDLANNGFPGEGADVDRNGSHFVLVKTHGSDPSVRQRYDRVILLVRHPKEAIWSDFNRVYGGGHLETATEDKFKYWQEFFQLHLKAWVSFHRDWLTFNKSMLVIFYGDLVSQTQVHLRKTLNYLQVNASQSRIACAVSQGHRFRRPRSRRQPKLYSLADLRTLEEVYKNTTAEISQIGLLVSRNV